MRSAQITATTATTTTSTPASQTTTPMIECSRNHAATPSTSTARTVLPIEREVCEESKDEVRS